MISDVVFVVTPPKLPTYDANDDPLITKLLMEALMNDAFVADRFMIDAVFMDTLPNDALFDS